MGITADALFEQLLLRLRRAKKRRSTTKWSVPVEVALMALDPTYLETPSPRTVARASTPPHQRSLRPRPL
eukprot:2638087-Pyramimonas_sp.AAC.1